MRLRQHKPYDNIFIGLMLGATVPVLGHFCIENLFDILTTSGIIDEVSSSTFTKRMKTLTLLAICTNIIPAQLSNNFRHINLLKGIVLATFLYAAAWAMHFYFGVGA